MSRLTTILAATATLGFTLACTGAAVSGERASTGECPRGERCSEDTPEGLMFFGSYFYDEPLDRLGPVLVGGDFTLTFTSPSGAVDAFGVEFEGDTLSGDQIGERQVLLKGLDAGTTHVRIVDPDSGELYDRVKIETVRIADVSLTNVVEDERGVVYAGCEEMLGVRLIGTDGQTEFRAFDEGIAFEVDGGGLEPDPFVWDCFRYEVPPAASHVDFYVTAGDESFTASVEVVPVGPEGCPELPSMD